MHDVPPAAAGPLPAVVLVLVVLALLAVGCQPPPAAPQAPDPFATALPSGGAAPGSADALPADPSPTAPPATSATAPGATTAATATPAPAGPASPAPPEPAPTPAVLGAMDPALVPEVSGIAASRAAPEVLWLVDDGPGTDALVAVRSDGSLVTRLALEGVDGRDVEDLAAGPCGPADPATCLVVGDVGDNDAVRDAVHLHRLAEPADPATATAAAVRTTTHTIPGGAVDVEALVVTPEGRVALLTKEADRTRVLLAPADGDGPLEEVAAIDLPPPRSPMFSFVVGNVVTAADLAPAGDRLLLRTYDAVVELTAPPGVAPDLADLATWTAEELPAPAEPQGEAIAYLADGRSYATASEGTGTLHVVRR